MHSFRVYVLRAAARLVDIIIGVIEAVLVLEFVLELLAANPAAGFSQWIYGAASPFMQPFYSIFPSIDLGAAHVLDLSVLCAVAVYGLLGWLITRALWFSTMTEPL